MPLDIHSISEAIYDAYVADGTLSGLATMHNAQAKVGTSTPYVVFHVISVVPEHPLGTSSNLPIERARVQFSMYGDQSNILSLINALDSVYGQDGSLTFDGSEYSHMRSVRDNHIGPEIEDDVYSATADYIFTIEEI